MRLNFVSPPTVGRRHLHSFLLQWSPSKWSIHVHPLLPQLKSRTRIFFHLLAVPLERKTYSGKYLPDPSPHLRDTLLAEPGPSTHLSIPLLVQTRQTLCLAVLAPYLFSLQLLYVCVSSLIRKPVNVSHSPSQAILAEYTPLSCYWDILRVIPSPYSSFNVHCSWATFRQTRCRSVRIRC